MPEVARRARHRDLDFHMATVSPFFPTTGSEAEWNAAYYRLEDYLRALRLVNKVRQSQLILQWLQAAAEKHAQDPTRNPTALALEEADAALEQWFARILPEAKRPLVLGYAALCITNGAEKWPMSFLADEVPQEFLLAMRENDLRAGPDLEVSRMVPRPIDVPLVADFFKDSAEEMHKGSALIAVVTIATIITLITLFFNS